MSGSNRLKIAEITISKLRGKALADELAKQLNSQEQKTDADYAKRTKK